MVVCFLCFEIIHYTYWNIFGLFCEGHGLRTLLASVRPFGGSGDKRVIITDNIWSVDESQ